MYFDEIDSCHSNLIIEKSVDMTHAIVGDTIQYSIKVINEGEVLINGITIIDNLESNLMFVPCSLLLDGKPLDKNILNGINIGCLIPNQIKTLTFKATITSMPKTGCINNFAVAKYFYDQYSCNQLKVLDKKSNLVSVNVDLAELEVFKRSNKEIASLDDEITYEVMIKNIGTLEAIGVLFIDHLPKEVYLIPNSLKVNGETINYCSNDIEVFVGDLTPCECIFITYVVKVTSYNCKHIIKNSAHAAFSYNLCNYSFGEKISKCTILNTSKTELGISTFKQISIDSDLYLPHFKPGIKEINNLQCDVCIEEFYDITTPESISSEGQILTGYKLIVRGFLNYLLEYISDDCHEKICVEFYKIPFSTFIILPSDYTLGSNISTTVAVEDVYFKKINCECFFTNVTFLLNAQILCC